MEQKVFVCLWLPCSGKSTQSRKLAEILQAHRIESWARIDMISRWEIFPDLQELAQIVKTHPWELTQEEKDTLTYAQLWDVTEQQSDYVVLDGFWRNASQYKILCDVFWKFRLYFIVFHITAKTMYKRAEWRFMDPVTRESFQDITQEDALLRWLVRRRTDTPEVLARRLNSFQNHAVRVLNTHRQDKWYVNIVNAGHPKVEDVTKDMMAKIRHLITTL